MEERDPLELNYLFTPQRCTVRKVRKILATRVVSIAIFFFFTITDNYCKTIT